MVAEPVPFFSPKIESAAQHRKIAQTLGLFSGRDGYEHQSVSGRHENSGTRRGRELAEGRARVGRLRRELEAMPEDADLGAVEEVVRRHSPRRKDAKGERARE